MTFKHQAPALSDGTDWSAKAKVAVLFTDDFFAAKCFNLWEAHLAWLQDLGWTRALDTEQLTAEDFGGPTGHEVVDLLNDFIFQTGLVNAHFGLTSSDIVDNVRLMQVQLALRVLRDRLEDVNTRIYGSLAAPWDTVGFTHWQPAAPINWEHRVLGWLEPLKWLLAAPPCIFAKRFGGPVGDRASIRLICESVGANYSDHPFDWHQFDLEHPNNAHPIQSSDHQCEIDAINWCCKVAAQLHKIALDLRFLASQGIVVLDRRPGHAGSSSMPHKTNPYKWEKVCSICRSISTTQPEMWAVAAHNSLERTLDTSWQHKALLLRCFSGLAIALDTMADVQMRHGPRDRELLLEKRDLISSDRDLTRQVLAGKSRWAAYKDALSQVNQPKAT